MIPLWKKAVGNFFENTCKNPSQSPMMCPRAYQSHMYSAALIRVRYFSIGILTSLSPSHLPKRHLYYIPLDMKNIKYIFSTVGLIGICAIVSCTNTDNTASQPAHDTELDSGKQEHSHGQNDDAQDDDDNNQNHPPQQSNGNNPNNSQPPGKGSKGSGSGAGPNQQAPNNQSNPHYSHPTDGANSGMGNFGNTCFFASTMQLMTNDRVFNETLENAPKVIKTTPLIKTYLEFAAVLREADTMQEGQHFVANHNQRVLAKAKAFAHLLNFQICGNQQDANDYFVDLIDQFSTIYPPLKKNI